VSGARGLLCPCVWLTASSASAQPDAPRTEYFTGFDVSDNYASGYVGAGYAFGKAGLYAPGLRLRALGAYGRYDYEGTRLVDGEYLPTIFDGQDAYLAALIGYQFRPGQLILKLFAGVEAEDQHIVPHDPNNSVQGRELGARPLRTSLSPRRRVLRHGLSGILESGPSRLSLSPRASPSGWKAARSATLNTMRNGEGPSRG
jgi:Cellulose biosynthesis protein BcsS